MRCGTPARDCSPVLRTVFLLDSARRLSDILGPLGRSRETTWVSCGLVGWTYDAFVRALREGKSKSGVALREPMAGMPKLARNMSDTELQAMWAYFEELASLPTGK